MAKKNSLIDSLTKHGNKMAWNFASLEIQIEKLNFEMEVHALGFQFEHIHIYWRGTVPFMQQQDSYSCVVKRRWSTKYQALTVLVIQSKWVNIFNKRNHILDREWDWEREGKRERELNILVYCRNIIFYLKTCFRTHGYLPDNVGLCRIKVIQKFPSSYSFYCI